MKVRILSAVILLPAFLAILLFLPPLATAILLSIMCAIGAYELLYRTGLVRHLRLDIYSIVMAGLVPIWCWMGMPAAWAMGGLVIFSLLLALELVLSHAKLKFELAAISMFAGLMFPLLLSSLVRLVMMENGRFFVLLPLVLAFSSDTGCYFVGRRFGRHQLSPIVSPHKTQEGAVGGLISSVLFMILYCIILQFGFHFRVQYGWAIVYGILGSAVSDLGDLAFSVIKRQSQIKDYGNLIPGHGGILDRFDSMTLVAPLVEALLLIAPVAMK